MDQYCAGQSQKAVTAYFSSKQLLPFGFAVRYCAEVAGLLGLIHTRCTWQYLLSITKPNQRHILCEIKPGIVFQRTVAMANLMGNRTRLDHCYGCYTNHHINVINHIGDTAVGHFQSYGVVECFCCNHAAPYHMCPQWQTFAPRAQRRGNFTAELAWHRNMNSDQKQSLAS